ncbi:GyrI-like domain-containing protein [Dyadobacter aurulentus]|uniref:GyrI-like domain-containing protein n=1 Tax=Dyadobacter sp. UC 10 TaxID=2605428 RepID=UPI0011F376D8|nr:GyrI-like domain-containing protein [Dyadobacter sp. UC 10]KAA0992268.1 hypothetical protein FXO21_19845 [Dyadobacter sp. UC 10]
MKKLDLTQHYKAYYNADESPQLVDIEKAQFISITGKGDPAEQEYADKLQALYATAYAIKFLCKSEGKDFVVPKLQGQWSFDDSAYKNVSMEEAPALVPRSVWEYRMLIRMPDFVNENLLKAAVQTVTVKKKIRLAADVEFYQMQEGKAVQMLHVGPFSTEIQSLKKMQSFMTAHNLQKNGLHHEIYLSDFRKVAPEKLRTILREPVK